MVSCDALSSFIQQSAACVSGTVLDAGPKERGGTRFFGLLPAGKSQVRTQPSGGGTSQVGGEWWAEAGTNPVC